MLPRCSGFQICNWLSILSTLNMSVIFEFFLSPMSWQYLKEKVLTGLGKNLIISANTQATDPHNSSKWSAEAGLQVSGLGLAFKGHILERRYFLPQNVMTILKREGPHKIQGKTWISQPILKLQSPNLHQNAAQKLRNPATCLVFHFEHFDFRPTLRA